MFRKITFLTDCNLDGLVIEKNTEVLIWNKTLYLHGFIRRIDDELIESDHVKLTVKKINLPAYVDMKVKTDLEISGYNGDPFTEANLSLSKDEIIRVFTKSPVQTVNDVVIDIRPILQYLELV